RYRIRAAREDPRGEERKCRRHVAAHVREPQTDRGKREERQRRDERGPPAGPEAAACREDGRGGSQREPGRGPRAAEPSEPEKNAGQQQDVASDGKAELLPLRGRPGPEVSMP